MRLHVYQIVAILLIVVHRFQTSVVDPVGATEVDRVFGHSDSIFASRCQVERERIIPFGPYMNRSGTAHAEFMNELPLRVSLCLSAQGNEEQVIFSCRPVSDFVVRGGLDYNCRSLLCADFSR